MLIWKVALSAPQNGGGDLTELQKTADEFSKPAGECLPSLIPAGVCSSIQHLDLSENGDPFSYNSKHAVGTVDFSNINWAARDPGASKTLRAQNLTGVGRSKWGDF